MTWFKLDDKCSFHSKIVAAGNEAFGAWCRAGAWSSGELLDGFIPEHMALMIAPKKVWSRLESCGGIGRSGLVEKVDGGWRIHDFADWNPPAEVLRAEKETRREHARQAARTRWERRAGGNAPSMLSGCSEHETWQCPPHGSEQAQGNAMRAHDPVPSLTDPSDLVPADAVPLPMEQKATEPDSPPQPPVLTSPEPKPSKRKPKQQPLVVKVASGVGWKLWRSLYPQSKRNYGCYVDAPEDGREMARIVNSATDHAIAELRDRGTPGDPVEPIVQAILDYWFKEYLRDDGGERGWLVEQRHPLRYVLKGITKYGTPWSKSRPGGSTGLPQEALNAREALHKAAEVRCGT